MLKGKYLQNSNLLECKATSNSSYTWRSILRGQELLKKGTKWIVGDGKTRKFWKDLWIGDQPLLACALGTIPAEEMDYQIFAHSRSCLLAYASRSRILKKIIWLELVSPRDEFHWNMAKKKKIIWRSIEKCQYLTAERRAYYFKKKKILHTHFKKKIWLERRVPLKFGSH